MHPAVDLRVLGRELEVLVDSADVDAAASGRSLREVALEAGVDAATLDEALDYRKMAKPHG